ncbi:MAG TPA: cytochrome c maturation protein CcmE [Pseudomonadales bacterium]|jgi:cytochrome c-type biogenesis protein CcmE|nr:cytochrome c maturation protein CcmE [Pseudomonadales bacterium]
MHPVRRNRLFAVAFLLVGVAVTVMLVMRALNENINLFYPPGEVVSGKAPVGPRIRAGGMVKDGSLQRASDGLEVRFVVTDLAGSDFIVVYNGILPDLFREGKGVLATGHLGADGVFKADEVLAKHDENYMPPELKGMQKQT